MSIPPSDGTDVPSSPDDGDFEESVQIDMTKLVGDAVGNVSLIRDLCAPTDLVPSARAVMKMATVCHRASYQ